MILCIPIFCLLGEGALRLLYGKRWKEERTWSDSILMGWMMVIGLAEAAHLAAVVFGWSFSECEKIFLIGLVSVSLIAIALLLMTHLRRTPKTVDADATREAERQRVKSLMTGKTSGVREQVIFFLFVIFALVQTVLIATNGLGYADGDMTAETINTILTTDSICQRNPMTGQVYTLGMPLRLKILCLPTLYAILCDLTHTSALQMLWMILPAMTLIGSYLAFGTVARALFPKDAEQRGVFLLFVLLILWAGDYYYGMDGFAATYAGARGVTLRALILLPYTFGLLLRKKWRLLPFCILAEACIVWTLYGMGVCLFVTAGMILTGVLRQYFLKRSGKGDSVCRN